MYPRFGHAAFPSPLFLPDIVTAPVPENGCILRHYAIHGDNATSLREILRISELAKAAESCDPLEARKPYPL